MALSTKRDGGKQVPWFSLSEWHQVYRQIYSNDAEEQLKAYATMLAWKARMPKLPVGVDSTLSIVQVCLRDRDWTPKIDSAELPISYENDLCLMYSTTIMRFLNHISNIGHTRQKSLYQIAKQLNIPEWIVNLRHDTAHGHELPSIDVLRIAINVLLTWLHEEYWDAEAKAMEECYTNDTVGQGVQETEEVQAFEDLIELWTAVSLYIHAGLNLVSDVPDSQLRDTLQNLRSFAMSLSQRADCNAESTEDECAEISTDDIRRDTKYKLGTARAVLLSEISRYLGKKSVLNKDNIVFDALFSTEAFLPETETLMIFKEKSKKYDKLRNVVLPEDMIVFWKDIILLLQEKRMLETLIVRLFKLVDQENEKPHKRLLASLWISSISYGFVKINAAQCIAQNLEYKSEKANKKILPAFLELKIKEETDRLHPHLKDIMWFDISDTVPNCLTDMMFVSRLILNANELSAKCIAPMLSLVTPRITARNKKLLEKLVHLYLPKETTNSAIELEDISATPFTVDDLSKQFAKSNSSNTKIVSKEIIVCALADREIRNPHWKLALDNYEGSQCPIGILPWQIDTLQSLPPLEETQSMCHIPASELKFVPGIIDNKDLKMRSQINWENVLRKKKRLKRKYEKGNRHIIVNKALETAKNQK